MLMKKFNITVNTEIIPGSIFKNIYKSTPKQLDDRCEIYGRHSGPLHIVLGILPSIRRLDLPRVNKNISSP